MNQWSIPGVSNPPIKPYTPGLLGVELCFWFDNFNCEQYSAAYLLRNWIRTVAQQGWSSPFLTQDYNVFKKMSDALGHAPSTSFPSTTPPIVILNGPYTGQPNVPVSFSSLGTTPNPGATLISYHWDFADGTAAYVASPVHTYKNVGTYVITVIITDSNGMTGANQTYIVISSNSPSPPPPSPPPPTPSPPAPTPTPTPPPPSPSPGAPSVALNQLATASSTFSSSYPASFAVDGTNSTRWCATSSSVPQFIQVDLGKYILWLQVNLPLNPVQGLGNIKF